MPTMAASTNGSLPLNNDTTDTYSFPPSPDHNHDHDHDHNHDHDSCADEDTITRMRMSRSSKVAGRAIAPFLARHIPAAYAPTGAPAGNTLTDVSAKDPSTKFCYRHRPDLKCRRTADEPSMDNLQRVSLT